MLGLARYKTRAPLARRLRAFVLDPAKCSDYRAAVVSAIAVDSDMRLIYAPNIGTV